MGGGNGQECRASRGNHGLGKRSGGVDRVPVSVLECLFGSFVLILWWLCVFLLFKQPYCQRVRRQLNLWWVVGWTGTRTMQVGEITGWENAAEEKLKASNYEIVSLASIILWFDWSARYQRSRRLKPQRQATGAFLIVIPNPKFEVRIMWMKPYLGFSQSRVEYTECIVGSDKHERPLEKKIDGALLNCSSRRELCLRLFA